MRFVSSVLLVFLTTTLSSISYANYAEVVLYYGQRDNGDTVGKYQKSVKSLIRRAEQKLSKIRAAKSLPPVKFSDSFKTQEHFIDVDLSSEKTCKIGILQVTPKNFNPAIGKNIMFYYGNAMTSYLSYVALAAFRSSVLGQGNQVFIMDYPGFGLSECSPTESTIVPAALKAYDFVQSLVPNPLVIMGYSLGGAIAVQTAEKKPAAAALVLVSTFANLAEAADHLEEVEGIERLKLGAKMKGFDTTGNPEEIKKELKERNPFLSAEHLSHVRIPVLLLHGTTDNVIPPNHFESLILAAKQSGACFESERLKASSHLQLFSIFTQKRTDQFWNRIEQFLDRSTCLH